MTDEQHAHGAQDTLADGVSSYPADPAKLKTYRDASRALSQFSTPVLIHADKAGERLFVAAFDGTGNDKNKDPQHATNVARIVDGITVLNGQGDTQIRVGYVPGPGTQDSAFSRHFDGMTGGTYNQRTEEMYKLFIKQAAQWKTENPQVVISVANLGFSRGAEQAAGFARLVHQRGIQDPDGAAYSYGSTGLISNVTYEKPAIVAPGQIAQSVGLFDPVGTGRPIWLQDRRLPPSVISGFQIIAADERRCLFKSDRIIKPGETPDGRFLGVIVAGAHSDIGGSYQLDGLAIRSNNLMTDYLNNLRDKPYLEKHAEPQDPRINVVHRSDESSVIYYYTPRVNRLEPGGFNDVLTPKMQHWRSIAGDRNEAEPCDEAINRRFAREPVRIGELPVSAPAADAPTHDLASRLNHLLAAGDADDRGAVRAGTQGLANSDAARVMRSEAIASVDRREQGLTLARAPTPAPLQQQTARPDPGIVTPQPR